MSFTDPSNADPVQPEGQGGEGTSNAPYAEYLDRIPQELRDQVEPVFRDWDGQVTRRFQESSEQRKAWEPYEQVGVNQHDPQAVQWALQFMEASQQNPQAIQQWYEAYAKENGLQAAQPETPQQPQDLTLDEYGGYDANALKTLLEQQLSPIQQEIQAMAQYREQQEQAARDQEAQQFVSNQLDELKAKHPDDFKDSSEWGPEKMIDRFAARYIETDPYNAVPRAFADYQAFRNEIQKSSWQNAADRPAPAEGGGMPNAAPEKLSFSEAGKAAREFLAQSHRE